MKQLFYTLILFVMAMELSQAQQSADNQTIYQFTVEDINWNAYALSGLKGNDCKYGF